MFFLYEKCQAFSLDTYKLSEEREYLNSFEFVRSIIYNVNVVSLFHVYFLCTLLCKCSILYRNTTSALGLACLVFLCSCCCICVFFFYCSR